MKATASLNTKIDVKEKKDFLKNTEALGMTPSSAIKIFVRMFNEYKGFPFEIRQRPKINFDNPNIAVATMENGYAKVPSAWRDEDDQD